jgi:anaerobic selenocysteine-containing dehydrogenase
MEPVSRRTFMKRAGAAAAVAGSAALVPTSIASAAMKGEQKTSPTDTRAEDLNTTTAESIVARVLDGGEIQVFVGDREVKMFDRTVASRIIRATR